MNIISGMTLVFEVYRFSRVFVEPGVLIVDQFFVIYYETSQPIKQSFHPKCSQNTNKIKFSAAIVQLSGSILRNHF